MASDKQEIIRKYMDAYQKKDWKAYDELLTDDAIYEEEATHRKAKGREEVIKLTSTWQKTFPDLKATLKSVVMSGNGAVAEMEWEGTQKGPLEGPMGTLPPTGKHGKVLAVQVFRFDGDKIAEMRHYFDLLTVLTQIGMPQPAAQP